MPRRLRIHVPCGFYHVTLRGNHRQDIFTNRPDRTLLNIIVARAIERYGARLHAYCWMSNHLHFLLQAGDEPLSLPMRQIASEFAKARQADLSTTGHFFERRYHATLVESTDYLFTALRYVHLNPLQAGLVGELDEYPWSSHHNYLGRRHDPWLTTSFLLEKFDAVRARAQVAYARFMATETSALTSPFPEGAFIFGSDDFVRAHSGLNRQARSGQPLQDLIVEACGKFAVDPIKLDSPIRSRLLAKVRAWIAHQAEVRGIATRSAVARALGRSEGTLREAVLRYARELE